MTISVLGDGNSAMISSNITWREIEISRSSTGEFRIVIGDDERGMTFIFGEENADEIIDVLTALINGEEIEP